jgi:SsrA-binding protein
MPDNKRNKYITKNKNGLFNYEVIETYQAGIVLSGPEVKSVKLGQISLKGSYATIDPNGEVWLVKAHISPYKPAVGAQKNYDPDQRRKLLLRKKEISSLIGKHKQKGLTIVPINVYTKRGLIKVDIALARGKTKIDKRETIKKREVKREIQRTLKNR